MGVSPIVFAVALAAASPAPSDDLPGDPAAGQIYAQKVCAECHEVPGGKGHRAQHSLAEIAATPGMTEAALTAWLTRIPHIDMPDLILKPDELRDIVAYILSLQRTGNPPPAAQP